jgi:Co/Zn/Cd efflux system component
MLVDATTYLFNFVAERRKKEVIDDCDTEQYATEQTRQRNQRKRVLQLEIMPPVLSVTTLLAITVVVVHKAIRILILDQHRDRSEQTNPNLNLMLAFSTANLVLDGVNVFYFAKAKHLLGYATVERTADDDHHHRGQSATKRQSYSLVLGHDDGMEEDERCIDESDGSRTFSHQSADKDEDHANLNMCSAYTHVFADTLRSIAVLIASALAMIVPDVTSEEADATAAVCVSVLIFLSLIPLFQGLRKSATELQSILAQERRDKLILDDSATSPNVP